MKDYLIEQIRNIAVAGHGGTGKTSVIESMLYIAGATTRLGKVDDGNTVCDYDPDEIARKMSLYTSICRIEWNGTKLNVLDTPGFADFVGDVVGAMSAVETALIVVDGSGIVEVGTDNAMELASNAGNAKIIFINKRDKDNQSWTNTVEALKESYGSAVTPLFIPIGKEGDFKGVVDVLNNKAYIYNSATKKAEAADVPADMADQVEELRESIIDTVAEADDELMMKYLDEGELSEEEIGIGLKAGIKSGSIVPVLVGSATMNIGINTLLDFISAYAPCPVAEEGPLKARVFKTLADPYVGKLTYFKVVGGSFKGDSKVYDVNQEKEERVGQVYSIFGKTQTPVTEVKAGDIGAVAKLVSVLTGDTLTNDKTVEAFPPLDFPNPVYSLAVFAANKAAEDKMGPSFQKIMEEDPTFKTYRDQSTGETIIASLGDYHLGITLEKLKRKFGVEVSTQIPKIAYRETITRKADCRKKHKKQTGGSGQYGDAHIVIEPNEPGAGYEFIDKVVGGAIPRQYIPSVDKGVQDAMSKGIQAGYPCVDIKCSVIDGSTHPVDAKDIAFQMAAKTAFKEAAMNAGPVILEPIMDVEITVPDECVGDVIGDLNTKRGRVYGQDSVNGKAVVKAYVPANEIQKYCIELRSISSGRGKFTSVFDHYEQAPMNVAQKIIAEAEKAKEE
ncbi:MAG: elongation factor G [Armatimonadetes bacterium]|nr:elongation factor G [Candidatus Hippobium faecium]